MRKTQVFIVLALVLVIFGRSPSRAEAADFSMNFIISDAEFTDGTSMSAAKIQEFLNLQTGMLKSFSMTTGNGTVKTAAQIIADAAVAHRISPRVILSNIQKESSMLTRTTFPKGQQYYLDWVVFYGWCDSCSSGTNKGFENQINASAAAFRRYLDQMARPHAPYTISGWGPGITKNVTCLSSDQSRGLCTAGEKVAITPVNAATAALYTYTPHPGGNKSFWTIWHGYNFGYRRLYPDGSLLRVKGQSAIYLIRDGKKRQFTSTSAFLSRYSYNNVISVSAEQLFFYDSGLPIRFANYSLLRTPNGRISLLVNDTLRLIPNPEVFRAIGFQQEEIVRVSFSDVAGYGQGENITLENIYPSGRLLQSRTNGLIFFVQDGVRHLVPSKQVYASQFGKRRAIPVGESVLAAYPMGDPIGFKDGELVRHSSGGPVYFISNGQRRKVTDWNAAVAYRFDLIWKNLIKTNQRSLDVHPEGAPLRVEPDPVQIASQ